MMKYDHLVGLPFKHGTQDCYSLVRRFYADNFSLGLTDYARPDDWWSVGLDLYNENYWTEGFRPFDGHPREWRPADLLLMAVRSRVANHAAIYLGDGKILHHFYGHLSEITTYGTLWRNTTVAILRHKDVVIPSEAVKKVDLSESLPPVFRQGVPHGRS